jgi:tRNA uridine 5-carboxymethylaminomethyl modification enzyme
MYPLAKRLGLLTSEEQRIANRRLRAEDEILRYCADTSITPYLANPVLIAKESAPIAQSLLLADLARRPEVPLAEMLDVLGFAHLPEEADWASIELKYSGYLARERLSADRLRQSEEFLLPQGMNYSDLRSLSFEARQKLQTAQPASLGQAARIPGVSPSDLHNLVFEVLKLRRQPKNVSRETV